MECLGKAGEEVFHPDQAFFYVALRDSVGEPDMLLGAECFPGNRDDMGFMQQAGGQLGGGLCARLAQRFALRAIE